MAIGQDVRVPSIPQHFHSQRHFATQSQPDATQPTDSRKSQFQKINRIVASDNPRRQMTRFAGNLCPFLCPLVLMTNGPHAILKGKQT